MEASDSVSESVDSGKKPSAPNALPSVEIGVVVGWLGDVPDGPVEVEVVVVGSEVKLVGEK